MSEANGSIGPPSHDAHIVGNYILEGTVGQGSYGKVKLAHHRVTNNQVSSLIFCELVRPTTAWWYSFLLHLISFICSSVCVCTGGRQDPAEGSHG